MEGAANDVERTAERMRQAVGGLKDAVAGHMTQMSTGVKAANDDAERSFDNIVEASNRTGAMIGAAFVAVGGAVVVAAKGAIDSLDKMNEEAERLGMTTVALSQLTYAGKMAGVEFGEMTTAITRLSAKMQDAISGDKNAIAWFKDVGVSVTDASGKMKSVEKVIEEVAERFSQFEEGAAKTALAVDGFGRSGARLIPLLNQGSSGMREMYQEAEQLGAVVGDKVSADAAKFNDQMDRLAVLTSGAAKSMVSELLPALNSIIERFITGAKVVGGFAGGISMMLDGGGKPGEKIRSLTEELNDLLAARDRYLKSNADTSSIDTAIGHIQKKIKAYKELQIAQALSESGSEYGNEGRGLTESSGKTEITRTSVEKEKKEKKPQAEASRMPAWEAELAQQKAAFMLQNDMYDMTLEQEKQFWDSKMSTVDKKDKEYGALLKKSADMQLKILKDRAVEGRNLAQLDIDDWKRAAEAGISIQEQAADASYALGEMSNEQRLQLEMQFEQQRYEIGVQAIQERIALLEKDPNMNPVEYRKLKGQILEIERKHMLDKRALENSMRVVAVQPQTQVFRTMQQSFSQALTAMLTRAQTWRQALNSVFQSVLSSFVENMVVKPLAEWAMGLLRQTAIYQMFFGTKTAMEATGAATTTSIKASEATAVVSANAAEAASGAAASVSSIPFVGWIMAAGVFAAVMAMVMGANKNIKSAAGGYDIPAGVNPVTQLHEEEMVLPKQYANMIRGMAAGEGQGGSSGNQSFVFNVSALDAKSVRDFLKTNYSSMAPALRRAARNYSPTSTTQSPLGKVF